jgi:hypothetical protein
MIFSSTEDPVLCWLQARRDSKFWQSSRATFCTIVFKSYCQWRLNQERIRVICFPVFPMPINKPSKPCLSHFFCINTFSFSFSSYTCRHGLRSKSFTLVWRWHQFLSRSIPNGRLPTTRRSWLNNFQICI